MRRYLLLFAAFMVGTALWMWSRNPSGTVSVENASSIPAKDTNNQVPKESSSADSSASSGVITAPTPPKKEVLASAPRPEGADAPSKNKAAVPPPGFPFGDGFVPPEMAQNRYVPYRPPKWPYRVKEAPFNRKLPERDIDDTIRSVRSSNLAPYVIGGVPYVPNPAPVSSGSSAPTDPLPQPPSFERLLGKFEGEVRLDSSTKVWQMSLEMSGKVEGRRIVGHGVVEVKEHGKVISRKEQTGELSLFRRLSEDSTGLIVSPSDDHQFQLYYLQDRDAFVGNYYSRTGPDKFEPKGTVRLTRQAGKEPGAT